MKGPKREYHYLKRIDRGYAIYNPDFGLYAGWFPTRQGAINIHVRDLKYVGIKTNWAECRKEGDRCVKVVLSYDEPKRKDESDSK